MLVWFFAGIYARISINIQFVAGKIPWHLIQLEHVKPDGRLRERRRKEKTMGATAGKKEEEYLMNHV